MSILKKWFLASLVALLGSGSALLGLAWVAWHNMQLDTLPTPVMPRELAALEQLQHALPDNQQRILAVLSSAGTHPKNGKRAGFEMGELARAYVLFRAHGFAVDFASPAGGAPLAKIDNDDMTAVDHAFLHDPDMQQRLKNTLRLADVDANNYRAVYLVGGKGTFYDFPNQPELARIILDIDRAGGVIAAVCHGPAALLGIKTEDGSPWLRGRKLTSFSNLEETILQPDAATFFPFLLEDELTRAGASFSATEPYLEHIVIDGNLVTGQNPWSTWAMAEATVKALGVPLQPRAITPEEHSVAVLASFHRSGFAAAALHRQSLPVDRRLLAMHAVLAFIRWQPVQAWRLHKLAAPLPHEAAPALAHHVNSQSPL
jgi:putative intracellular protease/amidase